MRAAQHEQRLGSRDQQNRAWALPLPDVNVFRSSPGQELHEKDQYRGAETAWLPRSRLEWETRDTINNRMWADTMDAGPKAVTATMLAAHVSQGAQTMTPANARKDDRPYHHAGPEYFPDSAFAREGARPRLPPKNLFQNPWAAGYDIESGDVVRELRSTVKENNRFLTEDASVRMAGRTFEHQWIPAAATRAIADRKLEASELLRPQQDDFRQDYLGIGSSQGFNQRQQRSAHHDDSPTS